VHREAARVVVANLNRLSQLCVVVSKLNQVWHLLEAL
jgi:hypothetical protein